VASLAWTMPAPLVSGQGENLALPNPGAPNANHLVIDKREELHFVSGFDPKHGCFAAGERCATVNSCLSYGTIRSQIAEG